MSIKRPDLYEHQNPDLAIVDSEGVRGGRRVVADRAALYALASKADQLKEGVTIVRILSDADNSNAATEVLLIDDTQIGSAAGWQLYTTGAGGGTPVDPGADFVLYPGTGQNTDGSMTQKATTDALAGKIGEGDPRLTDSRTPTGHTHPATQVTGLATVATSGNYQDLSNRPVIIDPIPRAGTADGQNVTGFVRWNLGTGYGWADSTVIASSSSTGPRLNYSGFSDVYLQTSRTLLIGTAYGGALYFFDESFDPIGIQASRPIWARFSDAALENAIAAAGVDGGGFYITKAYFDKYKGTGGTGGTSYDDTDLRNLLNNKTNNATTAALSTRVTALELPLQPSELIASKQDWAGMTPRAALLRLINQGSTGTTPTGFPDFSPADFSTADFNTTI